MTSERFQRRIEQLLQEADEALVRLDWQTVNDRAVAVLAIAPDSSDARFYQLVATRGLTQQAAPIGEPGAGTQSSAPLQPSPTQPASFANGRYEVKRFLGEGGKKKVYLAHDNMLDRDVAFALIKTEGLDDVGRERITREAQAMGRLGDHPHIVSVYDLGEDPSTGSGRAPQPYMVLPLLPGGDVEGLIAKAPEHRLPLDRLLRIAIETCQGLEFAHGKGIVHRDLKPGNVWLAADGRAQIGDFGLAVAVDKSRLTQAGMMVGTVAYMPPEQAMGGNVEARSDLYSLGAMLYEMVCGRPPFVGDEAVAIIGQHINTPPIAPSWHRPDCLPALEALILRLLEKDPSKRPESAAEVRATLEGIVQTSRRADVQTETASESTSSNAGDPVYRRAFVGRDAELRQLTSAFDAAMSGHGGLVMIVGEPGIGKTALSEHLVTYVALRGGRALVGHCYEEGSLSLPYLPFVEAMRSYVLSREPDGLRLDLGTGASDVARIVSEVRDRVSGVELRAAGDPEDDRLRLFHAITAFLANTANVQPTILVLEDLHDADKDSLDLLLYLSRHLQGSRLLIVATYRDVGLDRTHPLSDVLAELRRASGFRRVLLRGLKLEEVRALLQSSRGRDEDGDRAEVVYAQTEGNPLYVQEVGRYLMDTDASAKDAGIPEGLRDVIGKRLSRLSPECNQVLSSAAVIGVEFEPDTLIAVSRLEEEVVVSALEEAVRAAVLHEESRPGAILYRFAHTFFRQAIYAEISAPRRLRQHQRVAMTLEQKYQRRLDDHAAEIGQHFAQSTDPSDLAKAVNYFEMAAARASSVFAFGEAVRLLDQALEAEEALDSGDDARRRALLIKLGRALLPMGQTKRALEEVAPAVLKSAESEGDRHAAWEAAVVALEVVGHRGGSLADTWLAARPWIETLERNVGDNPFEQARTYVWQSIYLCVIGDMRRSWALTEQAWNAIKDIDHPVVRSDSLNYRLTSAWMVPPESFEERLAAVEESEIFAAAHAIRIDAEFETYIGLARLGKGDRERADLHLARANDAATKLHSAQTSLVPLFGEALSGLLEGRLEATADLREAAEATAIRGGRQILSRRDHLIIARALFYLGRASELVQSLPPLPDSLLGGLLGADRALCLAMAGRRAEAQAILDLFFADDGAAIVADPYPVAILCSLLETAVALGDKRAAALLQSRLAPLSHLLVTQVNIWCIGRQVADALLLLERPADALATYEVALAVCESVRFRPEAALCRMGIADAQLQLRPEGRADGLQLLARATEELQTMNMLPAVERASAILVRPFAQEPLRRIVYPGGLSEREIEVLRLLAEGKSNQEIGDILFISLNTVARHVSNILSKAGVANRTEAATYAHRNAIV